MVGDQFGITKMFPSYADNPQYYSFPNKKSQAQVELTGRVLGNGTYTAVIWGQDQDTILWWEFEPESGNNARITIVPDHLRVENNTFNLDVDCELDHLEAHDRGYLHTADKEWRDVEFTSHIFVKSVKIPDGYVYFEARNGYFGNDKSGCCQGTAYGARFYWDTGSKKGTVAFYKKQISGNAEVLIRNQEPIVKIPSFYQTWFAAKFVIYNPERGDAATNPTVRLELLVSPVVFGQPAHAQSNQWTRIGVTEDRPGEGWSDYGKECDAPTKDFPITWANPFIHFGWVGGEVIQFNYTSFREIDAGGDFGEDPIPPPVPIPDPGIPNPDPEPPSTPDPQPPDASPPQTPTTMTKRLTLRREVLNNRLCSCDGIQGETPTTPPGGGTGGGGGGSGGGGGGGTGTLITLFNNPVNTSAFTRLASQSGSSTYYLRFGQGVTQTNSPWIGKSINRVELTIAKTGNPTGSTGAGVHCRIRKGTDDSIAVTLLPIATETEITTTGKVFVFENLTNTYKLVFGDKLLFEYDGGDTTNYIKIFNSEQPTTTGTKIVWQANDQDPGEYRDEPSVDICARIYTLTP